ncbi:S9 family peptidase [Undibacterium sp. LX40W]|uniref:S9 family peptidase n=1 Tax=Undibacterium nitidum TaxID=2762298 RepID=A0A923HTQ8_9BURK|nr:MULTISPECIES: prolyl oligopeptidase family serine peptidase [Undibacterium]MBC3881034.1 S9 family peptidase [Undibacterium nitidum]MBC3890233.1 S9 family peptidase [Undibacterium sp. LX40W]
MIKKSHRFITAALLLFSAQWAAAQNTASTTKEDPYQWLEDVLGEKSLTWVKARNAETRAKLDTDAGFTKLRSDLELIMSSKERIPGIEKMGKFVYNFWTDGEHQRGIWRRTTLADYRQAQPKWDVVIDVDAIAKAENENWVFKGIQCRQPEYDRCLISLSRGGADAVVVREYDLQKRRFVKNGFTLPEAKSEVSWRDKNTLFVATDFGEGSMTDSGYPRIVKEWQRGTPLNAARTVFEGKKDDVSVSAASVQHAGIKRELVVRGISFYNTESFLIQGSRLQKLDVPEQASLEFFGNQMILTLNQAWNVGAKSFAPGCVLAIDFDAFLKGNRVFTVLFYPTENISFSELKMTKNYLLLQLLNDVKSSLVELRFDKGQWIARNVKLPTMGALGVRALDSDNSDDYFLRYSDYLTPGVLQLVKAGSDQREVLKSSPSFFEAKDYVTVQYFATSKDGTRVPYFMVHQKNMKLDGSNPTLLYGYGGFQDALTPAYSGGIGKAWLERGGVYVVANIRGGGEYGPRWHQAALKENRQRAYDDFAAVAEDLIAKKITSTPHLGAMGGSNGGLLAGVALTQRPDLFGAVVSQVPLLDMQRFNKLLAGASWMGEYGNPDVPAEWDYIQKYSPYHNVKAEVKYPPVLFITSTRDDRVHPGHARKMAAKMLELGHQQVWYYENTEGGHGGAANITQAADMSAITYTFLWNSLRAAK